MDSAKKTIFISDLHLDEQHPEIAALFISFMHDSPTFAENIYILGDLFEAWIGDDDVTPFHASIIAAIKYAVDRGINVYFMPGNRDFLIGQQFLTASGCQLLNDPTQIRLYDQAALLMHGDTLCTRDTSYIKARKWLRNQFLQRLFLLLPLSIRKNIANKMRQASKSHTNSVSMDMMDVTQQEVFKVMQVNYVTLLVHGHTHHPGIHHFYIDSMPVTRIVLGAWHEKGSALVCDASGKMELIDL